MRDDCVVIVCEVDRTDDRWRSLNTASIVVVVVVAIKRPNVRQLIDARRLVHIRGSVNEGFFSCMRVLAMVTGLPRENGTSYADDPGCTRNVRLIYERV
jgi:hypothetical protein